MHSCLEILQGQRLRWERQDQEQQQLREIKARGGDRLEQLWLYWGCSSSLYTAWMWGLKKNRSLFDVGGSINQIFKAYICMPASHHRSSSNFHKNQKFTSHMIDLLNADPRQEKKTDKDKKVREREREDIKVSGILRFRCKPKLPELQNLRIDPCYQQWHKP